MLAGIDDSPSRSRSPRIRSALALSLLLVPLGTSGVARAQEAADPFAYALTSAERALEKGDRSTAHRHIRRALERDRKSLAAWELRARWAAAGELRDEEIYARHQAYRHAVALGAPKTEVRRLYESVCSLDPVAGDVFGMKELFLEKLRPIAARYEKDDRPHAAIRVHKKILALDPENVESHAAIERIAARPDPSLAPEAKPRDLFEDVSEEWIAEHDKEHADWKNRASIERENYTTFSDAGYVVLVRAAEAMEQMNAFYREFFQHGTEEAGGAVPRVTLHIFGTRDEYLELGIGPPVEWSGGHFTGSHVETYISAGAGFEGMIGTLFHEAAHQFVSLATQASGWLNEGLASFFEGTRILPNGTVIMNMPAVHRLAPLAGRMRNGWMSDHEDGIDPDDDSKTPERAPTFRIVLENRYSWGPPWYAPTWGVVYFLYNYQDPVDGRFIYRTAFREFIDKSGGRVGEGAVQNFEDVVLANPAPPLSGVPRELNVSVALPETVEELDEVWRDWILALYDEQAGPNETGRPYKDWARYAAKNEQYLAAVDHYEKGLVNDPTDTELLVEFAEILDKRLQNPDRAARLVIEALRILERSETADEKEIRKVERLLNKLDPKHRTLAAIESEMASAARALVERYQGADLPLMVMEVSQRFGRDLHLDELFAFYEEAYREAGDSLHLWELAYNERDFDGWNAAGTDSSFKAKGDRLESDNGAYDPRAFDYRIMTMDTVTAGDFSMEAEVEARRGSLNFAGFAFGRKGPKTFHGFLLFPGKIGGEGTASTGFVDLTSFFGDAEFKTWRHIPVETVPRAGETRTDWHALRLDVSGRFVDIWFDGELLASHEFASPDVLRGSFGLVCGNGKAAFRNIRYLERDAGDPAGQIERKVRLEQLEESGAAADGSYLGQVPPWPKVSRWISGSRESWSDRAGVPQLLVLFSTAQNDLVPIDRWLTHLAKETAEHGVEFVCIASPNDAGKLDNYLKGRPFPGAVGVDSREQPGIGDTNTMYATDRYNLPRLILLDVDQKVIWEGDPGFTTTQRWSANTPTYLDAPLEELIAKRNPKAYIDWIAAWQDVALPALERGDLRAAIGPLEQARDFDKGISADVVQAQRRLLALQTTFDDIESTARGMQREGTEPALEILATWGPILKRPISNKQKRALKPYFESQSGEDWTTALRLLTRYTKRRGTHEEKASALFAELEKLEGRFVADVIADLRAAQVESAFRAVIDSASERPTQWLIRDYFRWSSENAGD